MYFGALSVGADFSGGLLVLNVLKKHKSKAKLIFKDFEANFIKRATSDVRFISKLPETAELSVIKNLKDGERVNFKLTVQAFCDKDLVSEFALTVSIK